MCNVSVGADLGGTQRSAPVYVVEPEQIDRRNDSARLMRTGGWWFTSGRTPQPFLSACGALGLGVPAGLLHNPGNGVRLNPARPDTVFTRRTPQAGPLLDF